MAKSLESFDNVQERYLSSRSGRRCGIGDGTSRLSMGVDNLTLPSQLNSKLVSRPLDSETADQDIGLDNQLNEPNDRPLESVGQGKTVPLQIGRHQGRYQLGSKFADIAYADSKLPINEGLDEVAGAVASSPKLSPFFPQSVANEVDVTDFPLGVVEDLPSAHMLTCMPTMETDRSRVFSLERQYSAVSARSVILDNNQVRPSGIGSLYQHSAAKSARHFKLDKRFDPPIEPHAARAQTIEPKLASRRSPSMSSPHPLNFNPERFPASASERQISGVNDQFCLQGTRSRLLPARKSTTMPEGGLRDYDNTFVTHPLDERPTQGSYGSDRVEGESSVFTHSPRRGRRSSLVSLPSSSAQFNKYIFMDQSSGRVPLRSVKHDRGRAGQVYGKTDLAPSCERTPLIAAHRGDPQSNIFSTPQGTVGMFGHHPTENCFPLLYSGRSR